VAVTVEKVIKAPAEKIFALLSDPKKHSLIDGSNTVKESAETQEPLRLGAKFKMNMRLGVPYVMINEVVEYEENRKIAWQPRLAGPLGKFIGGRIWKYELEPTEGGTLVRETWDVSQDPARPLLDRPAVYKRVRAAMEKTLENIEKIVTSE
jgi:uncharacterized protein YndB with AHSA1/START domain